MQPSWRAGPYKQRIASAYRVAGVRLMLETKSAAAPRMATEVTARVDGMFDVPDRREPRVDVALDLIGF
jgi:hypothetical protein